MDMFKNKNKILYPESVFKYIWLYIFVLLLFAFIIFDINFYIIILQLAIYELS